MNSFCGSFAFFNLIWTHGEVLGCRACLSLWRKVWLLPARLDSSIVACLSALSVLFVGATNSDSCPTAAAGCCGFSCLGIDWNKWMQFFSWEKLDFFKELELGGQVRAFILLLTIWPLPLWCFCFTRQYWKFTSCFIFDWGLGLFTKMRNEATNEGRIPKN